MAGDRKLTWVLHPPGAGGWALDEDGYKVATVVQETPTIWDDWPPVAGPPRFALYLHDDRSARNRYGTLKEAQAAAVTLLSSNPSS
jgi:hypothetical protein